MILIKVRDADGKTPSITLTRDVPRAEGPHLQKPEEHAPGSRITGKTDLRFSNQFSVKYHSNIVSSPSPCMGR